MSLRNWSDFDEESIYFNRYVPYTPKQYAPRFRFSNYIYKKKTPAPVKHSYQFE